MFSCQFCKRLYRALEGPCCRHCWHALPLPIKRCTQCGHALGEHRCCFKSSRIISCATAFNFEEPIRGLIHSLKRHLDTASGELLCRAFVDRVQQIPDNAVLVAVPSHPLRRLIRGYCPTQWLAENIAKKLALPYTNGRVKKIRYTKSQKRLTQIERQVQTSPFKWVSTDTSRPVILFDDVITSGQTILNMVQSAPNDLQIYVWAIARTSEYRYTDTH